MRIYTFLKGDDEIVKFSNSNLLYEATKLVKLMAQSAVCEQLRGRCKPHPKGFKGTVPGKCCNFRHSKHMENAFPAL